MSVRNALLALVAQSPAGVYRLKQHFEEETGGAWPLNIGQVYQTMQRLERDGLVASHRETNGGRDSEVFSLTESGQQAVQQWWNQPVARDHAERDELVMKLAVAASDATVDINAIVQTQRRALMQILRDLTRLKAAAGLDELAWSLVLDHHIFSVESEIRWLDHLDSGAVLDRARERATKRRVKAPTPEHARV